MTVSDGFVFSKVYDKRDDFDFKIVNFPFLDENDLRATTYRVYGLFIRFTASAFRKLPSIYVFSYFPFGFEGRMWDLIVSVPDHCLSFYFLYISAYSIC